MDRGIGQKGVAKIASGAARPELLVRAVLDAVSVPILVLGSEAQIEFSNAAGYALLARSGTWLDSEHEALVRIGSLGLAELKALIRVAKSGGSSTAIAATADKQIVLRATGVAGSTPLGRVWPQAAALLTLETAYERDQQEWLRHLARRYRLTPMEQIVLRRIGMGETVDAIAVELGVPPSAVRAHLTALLDKTGRRRQSELLRLALGR